MLFCPSELKKKANVNPIRILHVGAHEGEERDLYFEVWGSSLEQIVWVEGQHELAENLRNQIDPKIEKVVEAVVWSEADLEMEFHISNNPQASSLLSFDQHTDQYPEIHIETSQKVKTATLENLLKSENEFDFINLDIQGAELAAIVGLGNQIESFRWIYSEVNKRPLYHGAPLLGEFEEFLSSKGFKLLAKRWTPLAGWGDAIFVRKEDFSSLIYTKLLLSNAIFYAEQLFYRIRAISRVRSRLGIK